MVNLTNLQVAQVHQTVKTAGQDSIALVNLSLSHALLAVIVLLAQLIRMLQIILKLHKLVITLLQDLLFNSNVQEVHIKI